jgi:acyl-CoA dehydrogenase
VGLTPRVRGRPTVVLTRSVRPTGCRQENLLTPGVHAIFSDAFYPLCFGGAATPAGTAAYLQDSSIRLLAAFFQDKGLAALKEEDRREEWYQDWIDYQARHHLYASVLSPRRYSSLGHRFNLLKLTRFLEVFAYFSPAHGYSLHVSFLGLFPILMSTNEPLKQEAVRMLEAGGLFAFGVSERAHGSDLLANEFTVTPAGPGTWRADGAKYYIGNANAAGIISVLAKKAAGSGRTEKRSPFVFFALRPGASPGFGKVRKIRTLGVRTAFVGEFEVHGQTFPESDLIAQGRAAWDAILGTVTLGKFFLGFGAVGICAHAFAEAVAHMRRRLLYGKPVSAMPHLRTATALAFARLTAMKLYAFRAVDYLQAACAEDRRYLLYSAVQKARVSTEGVKVMSLLSECVGARGFEAETYFELALRDVQLIPSLEGSTHINFGLTAQFIDPYFAASTGDVPAPASVFLHNAEPEENPYLLAADDRNARTVRFGPPLRAYEPLRSVANVGVFLEQVEAFGAFAGGGVAALSPAGDTALPIALGKCFSVIAYAQLVAENCQAAQLAPATVSVIFHALVEDLSAEALHLAALFEPGSGPRGQLERVVRVPKTSAADFGSVAELIGARYVREARESDHAAGRPPG